VASWGRKSPATRRVIVLSRCSGPAESRGPRRPRRRPVGVCSPPTQTRPKPDALSPRRLLDPGRGPRPSRREHGHRRQAACEQNRYAVSCHAAYSSAGTRTALPLRETISTAARDHPCPDSPRNDLHRVARRTPAPYDSMSGTSVRKGRALKRIKGERGHLVQVVQTVE